MRRFALVLLVAPLVGCSDLKQVVINEFVAKNLTGLEDNGTHPDWIELHNTGRDTVDLSGWYLTDDRLDPLKWLIPSGVEIEGKGFLVVIADDDTEEGKVHAGFNLSDAGEDVGLYGPNEDGNPEIDLVVAYGLAPEDESFARKEDGGDEWVIDSSPSPGKSNE